MNTKPLILVAILALVLCDAAPSRAQEVEEGETVRVRTRVVFIDALVKDKKTRALVSDLKPDNFEVLADGRPREITYFTREGDVQRKPLALSLVLDLRNGGAGRFLRRAEVIRAMAAALSKLPPADEVAILALDVRGTGDREWLTPFTRDRAQLASALEGVPSLVAEHQHPEQAEGSADPTPHEPRDDNNLDKKEGIGEIRTVNKDGSVTVKYVNKDGAMVRKTIRQDGSEEVDIDYGFELSAAVHEAALVTLRERPHSQPALIWISDGIAPIPFEDREQTELSLLQTNVIFSALVSDMKTGYKLVLPLASVIGNRVGMSFYGSAQRFAKQTGGEVFKVRRPEDYATGLQKIVGNLASRYSLGFTIAESEEDDGQLHPLEVRVRARDAKGKERKLEILARQGYVMPKADEKQQSRK